LEFREEYAPVDCLSIVGNVRALFRIALSQMNQVPERQLPLQNLDYIDWGCHLRTDPVAAFQEVVRCQVYKFIVVDQDVVDFASNAATEDELQIIEPGRDAGNAYRFTIVQDPGA